MRGPRFEQTVMELQPFPQAAIDLIHKEPIRLVSGRVATCDGGTYSKSDLTFDLKILIRNLI